MAASTHFAISEPGIGCTAYLTGCPAPLKTPMLAEYFIVQLMQRFSATHAAKIIVNDKTAGNIGNIIQGIFAVISDSGRHREAVAW